jgi:S1-C subfamily serine protease
VIGTQRQPSTPAGTPATAGKSSADAPPDSNGIDASALKDALETLGAASGGLDGALALRVFEVPELGLHIAFIPADQAETLQVAGLSAGAVVWRVESGMGQKAGLVVGDVVAAINGQPIATVDDLRRAIRAIGPGTSAYQIRRGKETLTVEIDCPACKVE